MCFLKVSCVILEIRPSVRGCDYFYIQVTWKAEICKPTAVSFSTNLEKVVSGLEREFRYGCLKVADF